MTAGTDDQTRVLSGMTIGDIEVGDRITLVSEGGLARVIRPWCVNRN